MRILYVGPDFRGSHLTSWRDAFVQLGHDVRTVDAESFHSRTPGLYRKIANRILLHPGKAAMDRLNLAIRDAARAFSPELTFFSPGRYVYPDTIVECRKLGLAFLHTNDDMFNRINQPPYFREIVRSVDCVVTIKSFNVSEFLECGAARVEYLPAAYDPAVHFPRTPDAGDIARLGCDIGFVGAFRSERADFLERMAAASQGAAIRVWGGNWEKMRRIHYRIPRFRWPLIAPSVGRELSCDDYCCIMQAARICLGLLNHRNRDLHTGRTFEIPACRGFMLAERTSEHRELFEEDKEAVYFDSFDEMMDKIRFYLANESERLRIAQAGYKRCTESGYRFVDRAAAVMGFVRQMRGSSQGVC